MYTRLSETASSYQRNIQMFSIIIALGPAIGYKNVSFWMTGMFLYKAQNILTVET